MQTFREVLRREEERRNLRDVGICVVAVVALTVFAFGLVHLKPALGGRSDAQAQGQVDTYGEQVVVEAG